MRRITSKVPTNVHELVREAGLCAGDRIGPGEIAARNFGPLVNAGLRRLFCFVWVMLSVSGVCVHAATSLVSLQYQIIGTQLKVSPAMVSVPKGVPGSVLVQIAFGDGTTNGTTAQMGDGAYVEATLRGPSFDARRLVGQPNAALLLPPLNLVGDYQLDNIRLIDSTTGAVRMEGSPGSVPVHVFDQVLVSTVTSRPLSLDEIQQKGIVIDQNNFHAVEFEVGFVLDGKTIPVSFPVVAPTFTQSTEIIPQAELDAKLAQAQAINQQIAATTSLPPELKTANTNFQVQGINFQRVDLGDQDLTLQIPPIPALMVIPGNIGYLHQFFSVQIFTENGAPPNSGLSVFNVQAELLLPPGPDQILSTNYDQPGDDPLRFARIGPNKIVQNIQPVVQPGPDGKLGTADDIARLYPGQTGQAEFLVEALQEGLHVMNLNLTADLDGLAAGTIKIKGTAAGSVLVRNPKFSLAFTHPRTIRSGEPYEASVTILNTSQTAANLVSVSLPAASLSGGVLESPDTVQLGTIAPGQSATATFRIRAQRTGSISFSNLTTGDDSVQGRFRLSMGIDERGVALSPDSIGMPDYVNSLPANVLSAANRVLGQALSVATSAQLPPGVQSISSAEVTRRVLELAEAGQRLRYGDALNRVLADLLLDWQGGRSFDPGFDQIMRTTDAGREFREAVIDAQEAADSLDATARLVERASDLAGRGEAWVLASASDSQIELSLAQAGATTTLDRSDIVQSLGYRGARGHWLVAAAPTNAVLTWQFTNAVLQANLAVLLIGTNGTAQEWRWAVSSPASGACYSFNTADRSGTLLADTNCDGTIDQTIAGSGLNVLENPPALVAVFQDGTVPAGRPFPSCQGDGSILNYGTVLAILFSKPMTQDHVNVPGAYTFENGNVANSVQIQPGARVALLNMRLPFGAIRPRALTATGLTDARGNALGIVSRPLTNLLAQGIALHGRVVGTDNSPIPGLPVTLTMHDSVSTGDGCQAVDVRVAQVFTDASGSFDIDFVLAGMSYTIAATDTRGLSPQTQQAILDSASGGVISPQQLAGFGSQPNVQGSLLADFGATSLPQAIAAAQGLDRAVLLDTIPAGSPRIGSIVPVALRFRGRGTVIGQVLSPDSSNQVQGVAVNLFPAPDSRELGRGLFTDANGRFAFQGVPLGLFSLVAQRANEQPRTALGQLDVPGQIANVTITLNSLVNIVKLTALRGRVTENDNVTPHPGAQVFVGSFTGAVFGNLVAAVTADSAGLWSASQIPVGTYDVLAISVDGKRKGSRTGIAAVEGAVSQVDISLQGTATVVGKVETSTGLPVANALVGGGEVLVRADTNGVFTLTGVPTGIRTISAGLEANPAAGIDFPRYGSASLSVLPGSDNFVVVPLGTAGQIVGHVLDANGRPVGGVAVAMPFGTGFQWVLADSQGNYRFQNIPIGNYTVSAPSPPAAQTDTSQLNNLIGSGDDNEVQTAIGDAYAVFTGAADPYLNGQGQSFNPGSWGYTRTAVQFDGQTVVADIHYLRNGTISGTVVNGQGVPIGAKVRLTGVGPLANGDVGFILRGDANSDPALGTFDFAGQAMVGDWGLQAASPFYPVVITSSGRTTSIDPDVTNVVLQFPADREVNGRLAGTVFEPDGSLAGAGVQVKISFGPDYVISTDTNGFFDTQIKIPAGTYTLQANDPRTGFVGMSSAQVLAGITNTGNIRLLGKGSLLVSVLQANGTPASNATVAVTQGTYPNDSYQGQTDTNGIIQFDNLFEGPYAALAQLPSGPTTIYGRAGATVTAGQASTLQIKLTATGTLRGSFVKADLITPITFAEVAIGTLGYTTTDDAGRFQITGIPVGTYLLTSKDPVTGHNGSATGTLSFDGDVKEVQLVEQIQFRGEIDGRVLDGSGTGVVANATVTLSTSDVLSPTRTMTTGPDGQFSFLDTLPGPFTLSAADPVTKYVSTKSATLPDQTAVFQIDIPLVPVATLSGTIYEADGLTPATKATVSVNGASVDTDPAGRVSFARFLLGTYSIQARSLQPGQTRSLSQTNVTISAAGPAPDFVLVLSGVGTVSGRVLESDGLTPVPGAEVTLQIQATLFNGDQETALTDSQGHYSFGNIAIGLYRLSATSVALGATFNGQITHNGQADVADLILSPSGTVRGEMFRADGSTPVTNLNVLLTFNSVSGLPGRAVALTDANGVFQLQNIPLGQFRLEAIADGFDGIARLTGVITNNGQHLDLGSILLDEADPYIVSISPANTTAGVPINTTVDLLFSEALDAASITASGIYLRSAAGTVTATVQLLPDPTNAIPRLVRITPLNPLRSLVTYQVVVIDGQRQDVTGGITGIGPLDLVGRPIPAPFLSTFTTADKEPPFLVSVTPTNNAIQVDPRSVIRLSFNKPIRDTNIAVTLTGPKGVVGGAASVGLNGLVLVFTPTALLDVNASYTVSVSGIQDLAGNFALNQPFTTTFATLDTIGPTIATLRIANNALPVAGSIVQIEAVLVTNEPDASVRFTADFNPLGAATILPYRVPATLPPNGSITFRAIATDQFGNDGPVIELVVAVVSNQPPVVQLSQQSPASGPVPSSQPFSLLLHATSDVGVTNVTLISLGAMSMVTNFPFGGNIVAGFVIPSNAVAGAAIEFQAQATDILGANSPLAVLDLQVSDGTPPALAILDLTNNAILSPLQPVRFILLVSDNSSNVTVQAVLSGALSGAQSASFSLVPGIPVTNSMTLLLTNAPLDGRPFTLTLTATDNSSNAVQVTRSLAFADIKPPHLLSVSPADGTGPISLWQNSVRLSFDEPLAAGSVSTNSIVITNNAGTAVLYGLSIQNGGRDVLASFDQLPLLAGISYTTLVATAITDLAGNQWTDTNGIAPPPLGAAFAFTTAKVLGVTPTNGAVVLGGTNLTADISFEAGFGANYFRFALAGQPAVTVNVAANSTNAAASFLVRLNATNLSLSITASDDASFSRPFAAATTTLVFGGNAVTDQPPVVQLLRTFPTNGPLAVGMLFSLNLSATDDFGVTNLTFSGSGAVVTNLVFGDGALRRFTFQVPTNTPSGALQRFSAFALDNGGLTSVVAVLNLNILPLVSNIGPGEIVYSRGGSPDGSIFVASPDGSNERQITVGEQPKLSLDGRYVAFHRDNANYSQANLYVRDLLTGQENLLVNDSDHIVGYGWRADSTRLVYDLGCNLFDIDRNGSAQVTLSGAICQDDAPAVNWIDGRIAFHNTISGGGIGLLLTNGAARTIIAGTQPGDVWPAWSADGEWISFQDGVNFFKVRPDGSAFQELTFLTGTNRFQAPGAWTADGAQIITAGYIGGTNGLFAIKTDGSGFTFLQTDAGPLVYDFVGSVNTGYVPGPPPRLIGSTPANQATQQSLWTDSDSLLFSKSIAPGTVITNLVLFTNNLGTASPYSLQPRGTSIRIQPQVPLQPGLIYTAVLLPGLTDAAGQALLDSNGQPLAAGGLELSFTTSAIKSVAPANGASFVAGSFVTATVTFEPNLGADSFQFVIDNGIPIDVPVTVSDTTASASLALPFNNSNAVLHISAQRNNSPAYDLAPIALQLTPPAGSAPIVFVVTNQVTIAEGSVSNVSFSANSSVGSLADLDLPPDITPGFVWLDALNYSLVGTNGIAAGDLVLAPLTGDAGTYVVTLRATAANGLSSTTNITVRVTANPFAAFTRWQNPVDGNWSDATKWSAGVPNATNDAIINAAGTYAVTLDVDATVSNLMVGAISGALTLSLPGHILTINGQGQVRSNGLFNLAGGTLSGTGALVVHGALNWTGGNIIGSGATTIASGGSLVISGANNKVFSQRTINNSGTLAWSGTGNLDTGNGATINNQAGGVFDLQSDQAWFYDLGGNLPVLNNAGLLKKSGGTGTSTLGSIVNNDGSLLVQAGTVSLNNGGDSHGSFNASAGTTLNFGNGTMTLETNSTVSAAGTIGFSGGTVNINGGYTVSGSTEINGGTAIFNGSASTQDGTLSVGNLGGAGSLTVSGALIWTGGNIIGSGATTIASGGSLVISGANNKVFSQRTINNSGTLTWSGTGNLDTGNGATINNQPGGVFDLQSDQTWIYDLGGNLPVLNNAGTLKKSGGTGTSTLGSIVNNDGSLLVQAGTVSLNNGGDSHGSFNASAGTTLNFGNGTMTLETNSTVSAAGTIGFSGATVNINGGYTVSGSTAITGGTANFNGTVNTQDGTVSAGSLGGAGTLTVSGTLIWTGGNMVGSGATTIASGGSLVITGGNDKGFLQRTINNVGTLTWSGTGNLNTGNGATINNQAGGVFDLQSDQAWFYNLGGNLPVLNNAGTLKKSAGTGTSTLSSIVNNDGALDVQSGTADLASGGISSGQFLVRTNATLRFSSGTHSLKNGVSFADVGTVRFQTPIQVGTNINFGSLTIFFENNATLTGTNTLSNAASGTITFNESMTVTGSMDIAGKLVIGGSSLTITINGTLTLESSGELDNPGTLHAGAFVNNGGTIVGNSPQVIPGLGSASIHIDGIHLNPAHALALLDRHPEGTSRNLTLTWHAPPNQTCVIESSADLVRWTTQSAFVSEVAPGRYQGIVQVGDNRKFFRIHR